MRIAVAGATGRIGQRTMAALRQAGQTPVPISRSGGVDVLTGAGLDAALAGAETVIDVTNTTAADPEETVRFFHTATVSLLAAEQRAGVGHHVLLSIVGVELVPATRTTAARSPRKRWSPRGRCVPRSSGPPSSSTSR